MTIHGEVASDPTDSGFAIGLLLPVDASFQSQTVYPWLWFRVHTVLSSGWMNELELLTELRETGRSYGTLLEPYLPPRNSMCSPFWKFFNTCSLRFMVSLLSGRDGNIGKVQKCDWQRMWSNTNGLGETPSRGPSLQTPFSCVWTPSEMRVLPASRQDRSEKGRVD